MQPVAKGELMTTSQTVRTIADIARLAGVSKSTVSRALNDSPLISQETKSRIQAIAAAHDFELHQGARSLSLQRTQTLAVVFPFKPQFGQYVTDHPFNIEMLGALANAVAEYGYDLLVAQTQQGERKNLERYIASKRADGLILFTCDPGQVRQPVSAQYVTLLANFHDSHLPANLAPTVVAEPGTPSELGDAVSLVGANDAWNSWLGGHQFASV